MRPPKLTDKQKERLYILEPKLKEAIVDGNFSVAKSLVVDLQSILRPTGHLTRLIQSKNRLYELALEINELDFAIKGFEGNRQLVSDRTRLYLEATALLAICYLRKEEIEKAKPLISEVLINDDVIKTERTRKIFRIEIVERFNEETALYSLKNKDVEQFTEDELEREIALLLTTNKSENELYLSIGRAVPQHTKHLLFQVHQFSIKQLPSAERLALPSAEQKIKDKEVGKTVFQSVKRVIYNSLCDPKSEIYQAWFTNGLPSMVLSKGYIRTTIATSLVNIGIGMKMIIAYVIALVMRFGLDVYCEHYKPLDLMGLREK
ncbi:hypothetical protein [Flagellimonas algicola]|uniref:Tetratricopeptide repeat protein n=1 Tax=Flagellimonas algicola TaxID=2583815 RepID=A0ABY2WH25_9FLAO|nr:hypothetical protein [Allomuricauda algicola]TMU50744.1 hypothetical protein FGG15_18265 [Allomuricauda algicola]